VNTKAKAAEVTIAKAKGIFETFVAVESASD
jgi:hypothetical protein